MMRLAYITRDHADAGGVNTLLAVWGFVDETTFLTKAGHVGCVFHLTGIDHEGLTHPQRASLTHRIEAALRQLDERCTLYQYVLKRRVPPFEAVPCAQPVAREAIERRVSYLNNRLSTLSRSEHYLALLYEGESVGETSTRLRQALRSPRQALRDWLSLSQTLTVLEHGLDESIRALNHRAEAFEVQMTDFGLVRLQKAEAFRFLRHLINLDTQTASASPLRYDTHLDYFIADSAIERQRDHLFVGRRVAKVLTMKEPPSRTYASLSTDLLAIPGEFTACLEWRRLPSDRMRRDIKSRQRHFFNRRVSLVNYVGPETRSEGMLVDDSASAVVAQLGEAMTELEVHGRTFGACSLTMAVIGDDLASVRQHAAKAVKALAAHDGCFVEETYNLLHAWLSMVPGNTAHNVRRLALLDTNLADLSFTFTHQTGEPASSHLQQPALATFETPHGTPYAFNLHVQDVGHTLVLGATGSGKSFLLNFLVTHAQQYEPQTVILDLGHSYRKLASLLGGRYLEIGLRRSDVRMNPFALAPTPEHLHFLHGFVRVLLEGEDGYRLSEREDREIYDAVENVFVLDRGQRRLGTVAHLLPRGLATRLHKWISGGRYADLFDNLDDTLTIDRLQVFDFQAMRTFPTLLEPLLFYVLYRVTAHVQDAGATHLKVCVLDEAWRFIQHPTLRRYVQEGLKTWRKHNAAMILATQTIEDFASVDLLRTVVESCPTKLLLANPAFEAPRYAELFQLNEMELALLATLVPRQQFLLKRPHVSKVLTLNVDPTSYWIYTNTPPDNDRVSQASKHGHLRSAIDALALTTES